MKSRSGCARTEQRAGAVSLPSPPAPDVSPNSPTPARQTSLRVAALHFFLFARKEKKQIKKKKKSSKKTFPGCIWGLVLVFFFSMSEISAFARVPGASVPTGLQKPRRGFARPGPPEQGRAAAPRPEPELFGNSQAGVTWGKGKKEREERKVKKQMAGAVEVSAGVPGREPRQGLRRGYHPTSRKSGRER